MNLWFPFFVIFGSTVMVMLMLGCVFNFAAVTAIVQRYKLQLLIAVLSFAAVGCLITVGKYAYHLIDPTAIAQNDVVPDSYSQSFIERGCKIHQIESYRDSSTNYINVSKHIVWHCSGSDVAYFQYNFNLGSLIDYDLYHFTEHKDDPSIKALLDSTVAGVYY